MLNNLNKVAIIRTPSYSFNNNKWVRDYDVPFLLKYAEATINEKLHLNTQFIDCIAERINWDNLFSRCVEFDPDVIVLNALSCDRDQIIKYIEKLKIHKNSLIIIVVGQDATENPQEYVNENTFCDFVILGECENTLIKLLNSDNQNIYNNNIRGVYSRKYDNREIQYVEDLSNLPALKFDRKQLSNYQISYPVRLNKKVIWGHVLTSRGCPYGCIFCSQSIRQTYGKKIRLRPVSSIIEEIVHLKELGVNAINFNDDDFSCSYKHVESICKELINKNCNINWAAQLRIDEIDIPLLKLMRESGCILLRFGLESGSKDILKKLRKTNDPEYWLNRARIMIPEARKLGIDTVAMFILGSPTETRSQMNKTLEFAIELNPDFLQLHYFTPYEETVFFKENKNELANHISEGLPFHYEAKYKFGELSAEELINTGKIFYKRFYLRFSCIISNIRKFAPFYTKNLHVFYPLLKQMGRQL